MDAAFYWDMTYKEILTAIQAKQRHQEREMRLQAQMIHTLGSLVAVGVNSPKKYPKLEDSFPHLFKQQIVEKSDNSHQPQVVQQNWEIMKARVEAYAAERQKRGEMLNGDT